MATSPHQQQTNPEPPIHGSSPASVLMLPGAGVISASPIGVKGIVVSVVVILRTAMNECSELSWDGWRVVRSRF